MASDKMTIMVVDDIEDNRTLLELMLEDDYNIAQASSGSQCLDDINNTPIDLILLDVNMPEMDGYQVCQKLKENPTTSMIPVIFVSALDSTEARLKGYEAGGDEYLTKPVDEEMLCEKIKSTLKEKVENISLKTAADNLQEQATSAMGTALEAMTMGSEMGVIIRYMQDAGHCDSYFDLANAFFSTLQQFGLNSCLMIRSRTGQLFFGCEDGSLESKVLQRFQHDDKVFDFGNRTIVDNDHIAILVKNMPTDEPSKYGRFKDHLVTIANSSDTRIRGLEIELELEERRVMALSNLIESCESGLLLVETKVSGHEVSTRKVMQDMIAKLEDKLFSLGLDDDQERSLMMLADQAGQELEALGGFQESIHDSLKDIMSGLHKLAE